MGPLVPSSLVLVFSGMAGFQEQPEYTLQCVFKFLLVSHLLLPFLKPGHMAKAGVSMGNTWK
jgi:hypothetical protein